MKDLIMRLLRAIGAVVKRFGTSSPANRYESIFFDAVRSTVAVAFFPPGKVVDGAR